jgi:F0F1-type ATP synthase delta subunit
MGILIATLFLQCIIAGIVIFVLKRLLEKELFENALEKLHSAKEMTSPITVITANNINIQNKSRIESLLKRKIENVSINFSQDQALKGGIILKWAQGAIDCSLSERLKHL